MGRRSGRCIGGLSLIHRNGIKKLLIIILAFANPIRQNLQVLRGDCSNPLIDWVVPRQPDTLLDPREQGCFLRKDRTACLNTDSGYQLARFFALGNGSRVGRFYLTLLRVARGARVANDSDISSFVLDWWSAFSVKGIAPSDLEVTRSA